MRNSVNPCVRTSTPVDEVVHLGPEVAAVELGDRPDVRLHQVAGLGAVAGVDGPGNCPVLSIDRLPRVAWVGVTATWWVMIWPITMNESCSTLLRASEATTVWNSRCLTTNSSIDESWSPLG